MGKTLEYCDDWTFINAISSYSVIKEACEAKMKMEDPWIIEKKYSSTADESFYTAKF